MPKIIKLAQFLFIYSFEKLIQLKDSIKNLNQIWLKSS